MPESYSNYSNEVINEIIRIAQKQGLEYGEILQKALESGAITPGQSVNLLIPIGNVKPENFSFLTRAALAFGTPTAGMVSNTGIVGMGVYTGGVSILQYGMTTDRNAKILYALSAACSSSAILSGGVAVASRTCQISGTAVVSEGFGIAFLHLGNHAHVAALQLEGKPVPPRLKSYINPKRRPLTFRTDGLGFIMPRSISSSVLERIPFQKIGKGVGFTLAVYSYSRMIIVAYRYGQQFLSKYKKQRRSNLIRKQASFLINTFRRVRLQKLFYKRSPKRHKHILFCTT